MVRDDYGLKIKAIMTQNPQANAIIERVPSNNQKHHLNI
jgi:hypothetical protein